MAVDGPITRLGLRYRCRGWGLGWSRLRLFIEARVTYRAARYKAADPKPCTRLPLSLFILLSASNPCKKQSATVIQRLPEPVWQGV